MFDKTQWLRRAAWIFSLLLLFVSPPKAAAAAAQNSAQGFRLGSAASPFGWASATVIADFDSDAQPDFAFADRIGKGSRGYEYRLELNLSLGPRQVFRFYSPDSALNVSALDLDNDNDLDVVLTQIVTGKVVGVWINNGHGQFSEGGSKDFPHPVSPDQVSSRCSTGPSAVAQLTSRSLLPFPVESLRSRIFREGNPAVLELTNPRFDDSNRCFSLIPRAPPEPLLFNR